MSRPKLERLKDSDLTAGGGEVVYRVTVDGQWIGWVGDERPFTGSRFGGRRWWAVWREDGDTAARWNTFSDDKPPATRAAAVAALIARVGVVSS